MEELLITEARKVFDKHRFTMEDLLRELACLSIKPQTYTYTCKFGQITFNVNQ